MLCHSGDLHGTFSASLHIPGAAWNLACSRFREEPINGKTHNIEKKAEPSKEFGLPEQRKYPMPDADHARNAKARASQMEHQGKLSASDRKKIDAKADKVLGK